ncbi:dihydroneopterin aldolase [Aureimonas leprariae]|uniref:Dihydroneopterin aldolase n=1 Tax=Plantimonas leprariae TaxID=2615207 RepID=A0A7V7PNM7_9HYPH|nr:dihydroneopterin aldolase [Aureimonas leprariae]KAB0679300.1 dihydroneopterin aldolase [Aureimonas leprariae]
MEAGTRIDRVFVRDLVLELEIGVFAHEHGRRQRVRFSAEAEIPVGAGARGPEGYYSYDLMIEAIRASEKRGHVELVESHAEAIAARILADERVAAVTVRVEKLDLGPGAAGIEIRRSR